MSNNTLVWTLLTKTLFSEVDADSPYDLLVFQVQGGGSQKKMRNNQWKSGRKKCGKAQNGK